MFYLIKVAEHNFRAIIYTMPTLSALFFFIIEHSVLMVLDFYRNPGNFSGPESHIKILNLTITELFYSHILHINRGTYLSYKKFQAYTLLRS